MGAVISALWHRCRPLPYVSSPETRAQNSETLDEVLSQNSETLDEVLSAVVRRHPMWDDSSHVISMSADFNSDPLDAVKRGEEILGNVMKALHDSNTHLVGVYGSDARITERLLEPVHRRAKRDGLLGVVVKATVTRTLFSKPDVGKIQKDIAGQLDFTFSQKSKAKRANELIHRIGKEPKILIVLRDLRKKLDLSEVGIPYGADHTGCKIILTSTTEDVLSKHMHTQKNFKI